MKIRDSFAKEISRPIEGVIKADDTAHLATEVDEYVLTNEAQQQLESLRHPHIFARPAHEPNPHPK